MLIESDPCITTKRAKPASDASPKHRVTEDVARDMNIILLDKIDFEIFPAKDTDAKSDSDFSSDDSE
jgi:hypothetical protein